MQWRATIRRLERNGLGLLLFPLLVLRRTVHLLGRTLESLLWQELIANQPLESQLGNLLAFLLFSAFCLWATLEGVVPYVIGLLLFLLPLELLANQLGHSWRPECRVVLERWGDRLSWRCDAAGSHEQLELQHSALTAVLIRAAPLALPLGEARPQGWDVLLAVQDPARELLLDRQPTLALAWQRAFALARKLALPLRLAEADSQEDEEAGPPASMWAVVEEEGATRIFRDRSTVNAAQWWRAFVRQGGYLLFLAVLNTVMVKYGGFLVWMLGPRLGLTAPTTLVLDLSLPGLLSLVLPEWSVIQALLVVAALGAAGFGSYRHWSRQELRIDSEQVGVWRTGHAAVHLPTRTVLAALPLDQPEPQVVLWSERRPPVQLQGLADAREAAALAGALQAALERWKPAAEASARLEPQAPANNEQQRIVSSAAALPLQQRADWYAPAAAAYDAVRPGYPAAMIKQVAALAGVGDGSALLELGCGPGTATVAFARRGCAITALEPNPAFVALARERCAGFKRVHIEPLACEQWPVQEQAFDAVLAASSFHWIPAGLGSRTAARALKPGGALILLWNKELQPSLALHQRFAASYARYAPALHRRESDAEQQAILEALVQQLVDPALFLPPQAGRVPVQLTYSAEQYLALLSTYSPYLRLEPGAREALFAELRRIIDTEAGGSLELSGHSAFHVARKRG
ncbi:class I SAM-dependent methyltransferase [Synechococcus sp. ATX 2A4]|uniref:class I SAM-dependent methyltransferase n=1 Tax=Synechococcus sp. ATX 2A4 TaxID=2823727 RepID=UPI0020CB6AC4|nr:class I SAM-dependent methyltransferase [Synechococcus sp. ATX 2A4]